MRTKRHPRAIVPQMRVFQCLQCGTKFTITKVRGQTHPGHFKQIYCYKCKKRTRQVQLE